MLLEKIKEDLKSAMKSHDELRLSVLRMATSAIQNRQIEKRVKIGNDIPLTDEEVLEVLHKEAKKRKESIAVFRDAGRTELAAQEQSELDVIMSYLPAQMDEVAVRKILINIVAQSTDRQFGPLMKAAMQELRGKADALLVTQILKSLMSS